MPKISPPISRRNILKSFALLASAPLSLSLISSPSMAAKHQGVEGFLTLSSMLTGVKLDLSYIQIGQDILQLLKLDYQFNLQYESLLLSYEKLTESNQVNAQSLAEIHSSPVKKILKAWYLSQVSLTEKDRFNPLVQRLCPNLREPLTDGGSRQDDASMQQRIIGQINYDEALTWQACHFTKPAATCGGPFGYWSFAPQIA